MLLENKNAVIYGAGGAIGGAVARAFAREGARVFLAGRTLATPDAVALTITAGPREATSNIGGFGAACETIEGLWRGWAAELGPHGVRVVCLRPAGSPEAPDLQEVFRVHAKAAGLTLEEFMVDLSSRTLLRRLPTLTEVANVAAIMASDRANAMTGTYVSVTCGSVAD